MRQPDQLSDQTQNSLACAETDEIRLHVPGVDGENKENPCQGSKARPDLPSDEKQGGASGILDRVNMTASWIISAVAGRWIRSEPVVEAKTHGLQSEASKQGERRAISAVESPKSRQEQARGDQEEKMSKVPVRHFCVNLSQPEMLVLIRC